MRRNRIGAEVAELATEILRPPYAHVVARLLVHDAREEPDGTRCPCCNSPDAEIVETRVMLDMVVDLEDGARIYEADVSPAAWAEKVELADAFDVSLRVSVHTKSLFLDTDHHGALSGAQRAAKTTTALYLFALDVLRRGGLNKRAWLVGPTDYKAHILLQKLLRPQPVGVSGLAPAIIPPGLVARTPETHRTSDLTTTLIDGTIIELRSFSGDPGAARLKSDPCVSIVCDEAAHLPSADSLAALVGRTVDAGGRLILASTPRPSAVMTAIVVEPALEFARMDAADPRKLSGDHPGAPWIFRSLPLADNVFLNRPKILKAMRGVDMSRPENRRDWLGEWIANEGLYWEGKFDPERHTFAHEDRDIAAWSAMFLASVGAVGHVPITGAVRRRLCSSPSRNPHHATIRATNDTWLLGQDVNFRMESVLVQVSAPADKRDDPDAWHVWVADCVTSIRSNSDAHAERLVSGATSRVFDPRGSKHALDGCLVICDATAITAVDPHQRKHHQSGSIVDTFARHNLEVRAPLYKLGADHKYKKVQPERAATFRVLTRLLAEGRLHVASRCGPLLEAFATQLSEPNGQCPLDGRHGRWDERMGPVDALRYLTYAIQNVRAPAEPKAWGELPSG